MLPHVPYLGTLASSRLQYCNNIQGPVYGSARVLYYNNSQCPGTRVPGAGTGTRVRTRVMYNSDICAILEYVLEYYTCTRVGTWTPSQRSWQCRHTRRHPSGKQVLWIKQQVSMSCGMWGWIYRVSVPLNSCACRYCGSRRVTRVTEMETGSRFRLDAMPRCQCWPVQIVSSLIWPHYRYAWKRGNLVLLVQ